MKKWLLLLLCMAGITSLEAGQFGLGISAGEPTGLNAKFYLNQKTAIEGVIGWSVDDYYYDYYYDHYYHKYYDHWEKRTSFYMHVDYRMHHPLQHSFYFVYGVGLKLVMYEDAFVGLRIPLGLDYRFKQVPLDICLDVVPVLNLAPATDFRINPCISFRFMIPN